MLLNCSIIYLLQLCSIFTSRAGLIAVGWSPLRTRPVRKVHILKWSDNMDSLNYERRERIVTPDFELAFSYGADL